MRPVGSVRLPNLLPEVNHTYSPFFGLRLVSRQLLHGARRAIQRPAQRPSSSPGGGHAHKVRPQPVMLTAQQHEEMSKLSPTQRITAYRALQAPQKE
jgi:hypothetical protein